MDHPRQPNNDCGKQERVQYAQDSGHARQSSVCNGPTSPTVTRRMSQNQVAEKPQPGESREMTGMTIDYDPSSAPTALPITPSQTPQIRSPAMPPSTPALDRTEDDIRGDIRTLIQQKMNSGCSEVADAFETADKKPPITPDSLAELDMPRIINNPKLRHDVNFDRELHFRPNLDGSKGQQKMQQSDHYWLALAAELFVLKYALTQKLQSPNRERYWSRVSKAAVVRLPKIFAAIRDILKTLVPDYDQDAVKERLDVDHIMQQILNGVCNLIDLANWLSKILKNHCAPMRDALVDSMRMKINDGAEQNDPELLVDGLRQLMSILEAMKLDVANHQIRHMRPLLIDDTINFQRRYNAHRMAIGKLSLADSKKWISDHLQPFGSEPTPLLALTRGLICDLIYEDAASFCPPTFYLDADRLRGLRTELHNRIYHSICRDVLREFASLELGEMELLKACDTLTISLAAVVGGTGKFAGKTEHIAVEIVRSLLAAEGRHGSTDPDLVCIVEQRLGDCLRQDCHEFREHAMNLAERLILKVQMSVHDHSKMTAISLQDVLVPQSAPQKQSSVGYGAHCEPVLAPATAFIGDPDADLIRRFTHILSLHWQVWSNLVYLTEISDKDDDSASDNGSDSTIVQSRTGSPTVPIATAVYAPGRKWLPVSVTVTNVPAGLPTPSPSPKPNEGGSANNNDPPEDTLDAKSRQPA